MAWLPRGYQAVRGGGYIKVISRSDYITSFTFDLIYSKLLKEFYEVIPFSSWNEETKHFNWWIEFWHVQQKWKKILFGVDCWMVTKLYQLTPLRTILISTLSSSIRSKFVRSLPLDFFISFLPSRFWPFLEMVHDLSKIFFELNTKWNQYVRGVRI